MMFIKQLGITKLQSVITNKLLHTLSQDTRHSVCILTAGVNAEKLAAAVLEELQSSAIYSIIPQATI